MRSGTPVAPGLPGLFVKPCSQIQDFVPATPGASRSIWTIRMAKRFLFGIRQWHASRDTFARPFALSAARNLPSIRIAACSFSLISAAMRLKLDLTVPDVTTIEPSRTFWDKIVIVHGLRRWHEIRGELRYDGQRISRHYYDLHCLLTFAHRDSGRQIRRWVSIACAMRACFLTARILI